MKEILERAKVLIQQGHCKGSFARNEYGDVVNVGGEDAKAFCAAGAVYRAAKELKNANAGYNIVLDCFPHVLPRTNSSVSRWNDEPETTAEDVIVLYDKIIEAIDSGQYKVWLLDWCNNANR